MAEATPAQRPRRRVAVVVQRFGDGLLGGAEAHARLLVQALAPWHAITVLTSCAADSLTWAMHYPAGDSVVDGVRVLRFAHGQRNVPARAKVPLRHKLRFVARGWLDAVGITRAARPTGHDRLDGHEFLRRQGPWCPDLVAHLQAQGDAYDAVVFFTALYSPTAHGLPAWGARSLLVPTLHDEKPMLLPCFHAVFATAGLVLFNAAGERTLARRLYGSSVREGRVVGAAVAPAAPRADEAAAVRQRFGVRGRWLAYVGRIEKGKGCAELVAAWLALGSARGDAQLVLVGDGGLRTPAHPSLLRVGFVGPRERDALVAGARAVVVPSRLESLSLALLEALALGVPVVANGRCEVLADHVARSGAGESYRSRRGLRHALARALARSDDERHALGEAGQRYVAANYGAGRVLAGWLDAVEAVSSSNAR